VQGAPTDPKPIVEAFPLNTTGGSLGSEIERVCLDNELVIPTWSPIHLHTLLKELYWKGGQSAVKASGFFEDTLRYLYLPRFKSRDVLLQAIRSGAASRDFFGTAYGQDGETFEGFQLGGGDVVFDDTLLLIEPEAAKAYEVANRREAEPEGGSGPSARQAEGGAGLGIRDDATSSGSTIATGGNTGSATAKPKFFHATAEIAPATAKMRLVQIADEMISVLCSDPNATVRVVVEIAAEFPEGASDTVKRAVAENARSLKLKSADWE
jgi:hypothetical protein